MEYIWTVSVNLKFSHAFFLNNLLFCFNNIQWIKLLALINFSSYKKTKAFSSPFIQVLMLYRSSGSWLLVILMGLWFGVGKMHAWIGLEVSLCCPKLVFAVTKFSYWQLINHIRIKGRIEARKIKKRR